MRAKTSACLLAVAFTLACAACSKKEPAAPPPPPPPETNPTEFSIADTNTVVASTELPQEGRQQLVRADFNFDKLNDLAIAETNPAGQNVVSIYLRRRGDALDERYFKAGDIHQAGDYTISALMTSGNAERTDLLVIFAFSDGRKELVHFRSDGARFRELERKPIGSVAPVSPAP